MISEQSAAIGDVVYALTGKPWYRWTLLEEQRKEAEFKALMDQELVEARKHNRIYLQSQKRL